MKARRLFLFASITRLFKLKVTVYINLKMILVKMNINGILGCFSSKNLQDLTQSHNQDSSLSESYMD